MAERLLDRPAFYDQLSARWDEGKFVCVGLDSDVDKLPPHLRSLSRFKSQLEFNKAIVDKTADLVLAYKPNIAFYEDDPEGEAALEATTEYIHNEYPWIPVTVDAKRGDILNTNIGYAKAFWRRYKFDATTVHSYLGRGTYPPFLTSKDADGQQVINGKGIIAMCLTSNPDALFNQNLVVDLNASVDNGSLTEDERRELTDRLSEPKQPPIDKAPTYLIYALRHGKLWEQNPNIGIVVGATFAEHFTPIRKVFDGAILIPGIGTQGGDLRKTLQFAPDSRDRGMIINSASGIIFASRGVDFAEAARTKAAALHEQIQALRQAA